LQQRSPVGGSAVSFLQVFEKMAFQHIT